MIRVSWVGLNGETRECKTHDFETAYNCMELLIDLGRLCIEVNIDGVPYHISPPQVACKGLYLNRLENYAVSK